MNHSDSAGGYLKVISHGLQLLSDTWEVWNVANFKKMNLLLHIICLPIDHKAFIYVYRFQCGISWIDYMTTLM